MTFALSLDVMSDRVTVVVVAGATSGVLSFCTPRMSPIECGVGAFGGFAYTCGCHDLVVVCRRIVEVRSSAVSRRPNRSVFVLMV